MNQNSKWLVSSSALVVRGDGKFVANFFPLGQDGLDLTYEEAAAAAKLAVTAHNQHEALCGVAAAARLSLATGDARPLEEALIELDAVIGDGQDD